MTYHLLLGALTLRWSGWPLELADGHGPDSPSPTSCLDAHIEPHVRVRPCMEDTVLMGMGVRITCVWSAYGELDELEPLRTLLNTTVGLPDAITVGIGAWWAWDRPAETDAFGTALGRLLSSLDELLRPRPHHRRGYFGTSEGGLWRHGVPVRVLASTPICGNASDAGAFAVARLNLRARQNVRERTEPWVFLDRELLTRHVCEPRRDCAGDRYTARFHPSGHALNVIVAMLLRHVGSVKRGNATHADGVAARVAVRSP